MATVTAVRVSCSGEAYKRDKIKELCAYKIPGTHAIFTDGELSQFCVLLGIPVLICTIRPSMVIPRRHPRRISLDDAEDLKRAKAAPMYGYRASDTYFPNLVAGAIMAGNEARQTPWTSRVGAVLLARADKKPLETSHVHLLLGLLNEAGEASRMLSIEQALNMLTPDYFKTYYGQNAEFFKRLNEGEDWSDNTPWDETTAPVSEPEEDEEL